jgi:thioredoxin reductase (NADPH)
MDSEFDVVVAGCGLAGLNAALTSARLGRRTLALGGMLGGQLLSINRIDGYPGFPDGIAGYDLCPIAQEQAAAAGAEFAAADVTRLAPQDGRWLVSTADGQTHAARAVVIATGANLKELHIPGEERLRGKGVSHCASCDAPLLRGKIVGVVGGGDSAAQEALTLAEAVEKVILFHRGPALTAQGAYRDSVSRHPKIEVRLNSIVAEVLGEAHVTGVRTSAGDVDLAGLFIYIGMEPNTGFLDGALALDGSGLIATDGAMRTTRRGIAAAGAVRAGWLGRAVISAGDGAAAALAIDRFLTDDRWREA